MWWGDCLAISINWSPGVARLVLSRWEWSLYMAGICEVRPVSPFLLFASVCHIHATLRSAYMFVQYPSTPRRISVIEQVFRSYRFGPTCPIIIYILQVVGALLVLLFVILAIAVAQEITTWQPVFVLLHLSTKYIYTNSGDGYHSITRYSFLVHATIFQFTFVHDLTITCGSTKLHCSGPRHAHTYEQTYHDQCASEFPICTRALLWTVLLLRHSIFEAVTFVKRLSYWTCLTALPFPLFSKFYLNSTPCGSFSLLPALNICLPPSFGFSNLFIIFYPTHPCHPSAPLQPISTADQPSSHLSPLYC